MYLPQPNDSHFENAPVGNHAAICIRFIDLGTQATEWQGQKKVARKVMLTWEICNELMADGRPFTISSRYTWSMHEKAILRQMLESWRGRAFSESDFAEDSPTRFNIRNVLGKPCMVNVVAVEKAGKSYANVTSVTSLPKGLPVPQAVNDLTYVALERESFDQQAFSTLSDRLVEIIKGSPEWRALIDFSRKKPEPDMDGYGAGPDDEVPF